MTESQTPINGHIGSRNNSYHESSEPQHEQPDPVDFSEPLEDHDWDDLEARFWGKMEECDRAEQGIEEDFKELLNVRPLGFCYIVESITLLRPVSPHCSKPLC